ncbi:MAG: glycerophosphoryl diester phosphodiesterase [Legionellales bacterium RIFCSPHIGHO2_12_FULL_37_14]|nr:MAG: glycerophosphoryl diester phosphodiesterase [Legionellales bacterium RIFCSPHIGHO2_12_FULL_37_14]
MFDFSTNKVIAHRGASAYAPENTLTAFDLALAYGAEWIEFDVMLSKDEEPFILHDPSLKRTTNGQGILSEVESSYVKTLDAGNWFSKQYKGEKVPHLKEVLKWLIFSDVKANIEIKPCRGFEEKTAVVVLSYLQRYWPSESPLPLISSFNHEVLTLCRNLSPEAPLGLLVHSWDGAWQKQAELLNCTTVHMNQRILNKERAKEVKDAGFQLLSYTVNKRSLAEKLFSFGVDAIFSDYPDLCLA